MKQTLTFNVSTLTSSASKINVGALEKSMEAYEKKRYMDSFHLLLDYINPELRGKYGNSDGTEFHIPHGSIVVTIKIENQTVTISAPFLSLPEKNRIPLLRQVANLNISEMILVKIALKEDVLFFHYTTPLALVHPSKIFSALFDISTTGDKYDDEFATKFGAKRVGEAKITPYDDATLDNLFNILQQSFEECLSAVREFETSRKYGYAWNIIATTLYKIIYVANPQGQLLNELNKSIEELSADNIPIPDLVRQGKEVILQLQSTSKEQLQESLYQIETFVPTKRRSNLTTIMSDMEESYAKAAANFEAGNFMDCCLIITFKFYEVYFYNHLQDDLNAVMTKALQDSSAKNWEEAAKILVEAMENIMDGNLEIK